MAKGARASTKKANNSKLKGQVFGPVETARTERLSAKLLELASQPKPKREDAAGEADDIAEQNNVVPILESKHIEDMEVDLDATKNKTGSKLGKGRIEKRRSGRKASIVFPKYKNNKKSGTSRGKK